MPFPEMSRALALTLTVAPLLSVMAPPAASTTSSDSAVTARRAMLPELVISTSDPDPVAVARRSRSAAVLST